MLRTAVSELSWLLTRGYRLESALKLVGDRHSLDVRQRMAVQRCACTDEALSSRKASEVRNEDVSDEAVEIDGFNVLTTVEGAFGGAVVFIGRDSCCRDISSVHGTYRRVEETSIAIRSIGMTLAALRPRSVRWLLDSPVSNSGRLRILLLQTALEQGWSWDVDVVPDVDKALVAGRGIIVTADSVVLNSGRRWLNLASIVLPQVSPPAFVADLRLSEQATRVRE